MTTNLDFWSRLTTWVLPSALLISSFPLSPLSFKAQCFQILHFLGDPIDTMNSLLFKISMCNSMAQDWKAVCKEHLEPTSEDEMIRDRDWKAFTMITDAYGEWGQGGSAKEILYNTL